MKDPHKWTAEDLAQLTQLWADGLSARKIGAIMGHTRNAIIGKAHRSKLPPRLRISVRKGDTRIRRGDRSLKAKFRKAAPPPEKIVKPAPRQITEPESLDIAVLDLEARQCRWISGVGTHLHCGHKTYDGSSYCEHHYGRVYQPSKQRAERRSVVLPIGPERVFA